MLRNNGDARRCSYFELWLPVMEQACHKNTPHALWKILWDQEICCMTMTMQALPASWSNSLGWNMLQQCPVIKSRSNPCNMSWEQFCFKICAQRIEKKTRTQRSALNHLYGKPSNFGPGENLNETVHSVKCFREKKVIPSEVTTYSSPRPVPGIFYSTIFHKIKNQCQFPRGKHGGLESMNRNYRIWQLCLILIALG